MIELHLGDCLQVMKNIPDNSIDSIITDPPYLYLKDQKLDKTFDEVAFFKECYRVLKKDSFLLFFGRGVSLNRWAVICDNLGFTFKEELVWDKRQTSNPLNALSRRHELILLFAKGKPTLNKVFIDKGEYDLDYNPKAILSDLKRLLSKFKNIKTIEELEEFKKGEYIKPHTSKHNITTSSRNKDRDRAFDIMNAYDRGAVLSSILIANREHYTMEHPTQKPQQLMENLIKLVSSENMVILDPFMGGGSTGVACMNLNRDFIGIEIDRDYFEIAENRIEKNKDLFNKWENYITIKF